jgi:GTP-binding protein EngB required for normal cell division
MAVNFFSKEYVLPLVNQFIQFTTEQGKHTALERIQSSLRQYQSGLFRLVIIGEIKKGKSSFINALLGIPDLLPVHSDVATSTVYRIMYGETKGYRVFFFPKDPADPQKTTPPPLVITEDQIADYGTEDSNPGNKKGVDFIGIQLPHPLLKSGVMIIDTPGIGGLFKEHSEITWRYVPNADAIFFVLDSVEAVASKAEMDYLARLRQMSALLFFVQTKIDLVEETRWQSWRDRNLDIIASTVDVPKEKLIYFPVSAELKKFADEDHSPKDLERSGFTPLVYFIHHKLLKAKEERLARALLQHILTETMEIRRHLSDELQVCNTESKQALDALERELKETTASFEKWRTQEYPKIVRAFQNDSTDLKRETLDNLQNQLDPSPSGQILGPILTELRTPQYDARQLCDRVEEFRSTCVDRCTQQVFEIQGTYNQRMKSLIASGSKHLGCSFSKELGTLIKGISLPSTVPELGITHNKFEQARNIFFGGTAGAAMLSFILPPVGLAAGIAQLAAFLAGSIYTKRNMEAKHKEEALIKLQGLLVDVVRLALKQATQQFNATASEFERSANEAFENAASATHQELQFKLKSIADTRNRTRQDNLEKISQLKQVVNQADQLLREINRIKGAPSEVLF